MKLVACLLLLATVSGKTEPIRLEVSPRTTFAPVTVRAKVTIEPNESNKAICLNYKAITEDGDEGEESGDCKTIDGLRAPKTFWFEVPITAGGHYYFQASLGQGGAWFESKTVDVTIIPKF